MCSATGAAAAFYAPAVTIISVYGQTAATIFGSIFMLNENQFQWFPFIEHDLRWIVLSRLCYVKVQTTPQASRICYDVDDRSDD